MSRTLWVLIKVYNTQNYWFSVICSSSGILNYKNTTFRKLNVSFLRSEEGNSYSVVSLRKGVTSVNGSWTKQSRCLPPLT
jgi:hypothetical protein